jgi:hypothetical protein
MFVYKAVIPYVRQLKYVDGVSSIEYRERERASPAAATNLSAAPNSTADNPVQRNR